MRILNIEDNVFKHSNICRALKQIGINEVDWKRNLSDAMEALDECDYDLVITDMWYPEYPGGPDAQSGKIFIEKSQELQLKVHTILCSSIDYDWPGILGSVHYDEEENWESRLQELVRKIR